MKCRFCSAKIKTSFCDLGETPLSNSYALNRDLGKALPVYPLHPYVCDECLLVQIAEFEGPESIFSDYSYFSSYSDTWLEHAKKYTEEVIKRFGLTSKHQVVEIASNDGYLLQYFKNNEIPVLGIEPAKNVALEAHRKAIPTLTEFFSSKLAMRLKKENGGADLIVANNVLAHVPDLNDFVSGIKILLSEKGIATLEFPHLLNLIHENQFDTIYHEHFSYFSFSTAEKVFRSHGLFLFDVEELKTHGGSLRIYAANDRDASKLISERVEKMRQLEKEQGLLELKTYQKFEQNAKKVKKDLLELMHTIKKEGKKIAAYGAPAKGNTLLNYCQISSDLIEFTVDRNPHKQGKYLPGSLIPIYSPDWIENQKPDYLLILPWNLKEEIMEQMKGIRKWGGKFIIPIPEPYEIS